MMAVMERRSQPAVTWSAVDLEPKPVGPAEPMRYLTVCSISLLFSSLLGGKVSASNGGTLRK